MQGLSDRSKAVIAGIAVLSVVVVFVFRFSQAGTGAPRSAESIVLVDVMSGETFIVSIKDRGVVLPMRNPDTGRDTLVPLERVADGDERGREPGWYVNLRYADPGMQDEMTDLIEPSSGLFSGDADSPRKLER